MTDTASKKTMDMRAASKRRGMVQQLRGRILEGRYESGQMLPTEAELMSGYDLSRHSVRVGLEELVEEGLIERTRGKGTVVRRQDPRVKPKSVSLIVQDTREWLAAGIAHGLQDGFSGMNVRLELISSGDTQQCFYETVEDLLYHRPDGVVVLPMPWVDNHEWVFRFRQAGLPAVALDAYPVGTEVDSVEMDNHRCGYLAGQHLIQRGYRRLYHVSIRCKSYANSLRIEGFLDAVAEARAAVESCIPLHYELTEDVAADHQHPWMAAKDFWLSYCGDLLRSGSLSFPIGVSTCNDFEAYGVVLACRELGLEVGREVAIVGTDDRDISVLSDPQLTTLKQFPERIGQKAAQLLLRRMESPNAEVEHVHIEPELLVRESTPEVK